MRKKENRERRERPVKKRRNKKEESCETEKTRERDDILIEKYYKTIIFIRFELQWADINTSPLQLCC